MKIRVPPYQEDLSELDELEEPDEPDELEELDDEEVVVSDFFSVFFASLLSALEEADSAAFSRRRLAVP